MGTQSGTFSFKSMYNLLKLRSHSSFPKMYMEELCDAKDSLICLGSDLRKDFNFRSIAEKRSTLAKRLPLCLKSVEKANHLLLHCVKTRVLWDLLFFFFFFFPWNQLGYGLSVWDMLLGWWRPFIEKGKKQFGMQAHMHFLGGAED